MALSASLLITGNASAQIAPGKSGSSSQYFITGSDVWASLGNFGACYAYRNRIKAMSLLATEPDSAEEAKVYTSLFHAADQSCLGLATEMRVSHDLVRGTIAEGLYRRFIPPTQEILFGAFDGKTPVHSVMDFARCYVAAHADRVRDLVEKTKPGSPQERAAVAAMAPDFSVCLPTGAQIEVKPLRFRYILVEALYRTSPTDAVAGKN